MAANKITKEEKIKRFKKQCRQLEYMKELSIEEKAQAYDEAIAHAKLLLKTIGNATLGNLVLKHEFETMFPELKESEESKDEKIRKALIRFHKSTIDVDGIKGEDIIAWLEAQGEHANFRNAIQIGDKVTRNEDGALVNLSKLKRIAKHAEEYNITSISSKHAEGKLAEKIKERRLLNEVLKKQGEQKSDNKVEPKFKVGDYIINPQGTLRHIINVDEGGYQTDGGWLSRDMYEKTFHLWTIQDAKDGDVVTCPANDSYSKKIIFILKRLIDGDVECYCCINAYGNFDSCINTSDIIGEIEDNDYTPATKEQRDIFFAMMKEAGYEWDANRKELKKIEEEINGEDYGIDGLYHAKRILEETLGSVDGYQSDDGILDHKAAITAVKKLYKQKYAKYN